jgi:GGDEF domain-containing protein
VRAVFVEPFMLGDLTISIGASIGGGAWPKDGGTIAELARHADTAMYEDKARGRHSSVEA